MKCGIIYKKLAMRVDDDERRIMDSLTEDVSNWNMINSTWEIDFDSFNFEQAIAEILLELMENFKTCFVSEKIKCILSIDK